MKTIFISLTIIAVISASVPVIAHLIPHNIIPETVLLIVAGALLGPNMAGVIRADNTAIMFLSDLGCAFLFLLAGYEIDPKSVVGRDGKHGLMTWIVTFAAGIGLSMLMPALADGKQGLIATALLLTTTALGTLMPILASVSYHVSDADPIDAIKEIAHDPEHIREIIHEHVAREHERAAAYRKEAADRIKKRLDRE